MFASFDDIDFIEDLSANELQKELLQLQRYREPGDKNYSKYKVHFPDGHYITIENYGSGLSGTFARNAITGEYIKVAGIHYIIVGSSDEELLFKVTDSSGHNGRKEPLILYYNSPEEYENHHFIDVSPNIKTLWNKRSKEAQKRIDKIVDRKFTEIKNIRANYIRRKDINPEDVCSNK
jgi:hypothetical protein